MRRMRMSNSDMDRGPAPTSPAPAAPPATLDRRGRGRRALLSVAICVSGALPSFVLASSGWFSIPGMITAVALFAFCMTLISWSKRFRIFTRRPFVRSTLTVVYGLRLVLSATPPLTILADGLPGIFAVGIVQTTMFELGFPADVFDRPVDPLQPPPFSMVAVVGNFFGTMLIVLLQGLLLNLILAVLFAALLVPQRILRPRPRIEGRTFCPRCGYCRDSIPEASSCPECGSSAPPATERATWIDRFTTRRFMLAVGSIVAVPATFWMVTGLFSGGF